MRGMKASAVFGDEMLFDVKLSRESSLTPVQRTERSEGKKMQVSGKTF